MVKLIIGLKGSGKTKTLINLANEAIKTSESQVVVITKGSALMHEIKYAARLIDVDDYEIDSARSLYGLLAGITAANHDTREIFIDGMMRISKVDPENYEKFITLLVELAKKNDLNVYLTLSKSPDELSETLKALVI